MQVWCIVVISSIMYILLPIIATYRHDGSLTGLLIALSASSLLNIRFYRFTGWWNTRQQAAIHPELQVDGHPAGQRSEVLCQILGCKKCPLCP